MIKQAIIPAAGLGTRFLPVTKILPKELLPIMAKPALQYIVEELVQSGIEEIILVLSPEKESIFQYFSEGGFVDQILDERGHQSKLHELRSLLKKVTFKRVYQHNPLGLGHAVLCAKREVCTDHVAVVLPDDIVFSKQPCMQQLVEAHKATQKSILGLEEIHDDHISSYGVVGTSETPVPHKPFSINQVVEKPPRDQAPSNYAIIGRYILSSEIFHVIPEKAQEFGKEIQLTDAIDQLVQKDQVQGYLFEGRRIDVGQPIGFTKANLMQAFTDTDNSQEIQEFVKEAVK